MRNQHFKERYTPVFDDVCPYLGAGWKVDKRTNDYCITLINPDFKNYHLFIRGEKGHFVVSGGAEFPHRVRFGFDLKIRVSPNRKPLSIAGDIKRKILPTAKEEIEKAKEYSKKEEDKKANNKILIGALSQLATVRSGGYGALASMDFKNKAEAVIQGHGDKFSIELYKLNKDDLIKIVGFISTL